MNSVNNVASIQLQILQIIQQTQSSKYIFTK